MIGGGIAWKFGDEIDTDLLAPGAFMKGGIAALSAHCLEAISPDFAAGVRPGDIVVGGKNFGIGSSREQAAEALRHLGVAAVLAKSFGGIFHRNALNLGLPVLVCDAVDEIGPGDVVEIDPRAGRIHNRTTGAVLSCETLPDFLVALLDDGGLVPHLEKRFADRRTRA